MNTTAAGVPSSAGLGEAFSIGILVLLFFFGAPLNCTAFFQLHAKSLAPGAIFPPRRRTARDMEILKRQLNFSDMLVVFVYVVSEVCWLLSYSWRGGRALCKGVAFLRVLGFQSSSLVIVAIAANRLLSVLYPGSNPKRRATTLAVVVWAISTGLSLPQLWVWTTVAPFPERPGWEQCCTRWEIERELGRLNRSEAAGLPFSEFGYNVGHLVGVFWAPLGLVLAAYAFLVCRIRSHIVTVEKRLLSGALTSSSRPSSATTQRLPLINIRRPTGEGTEVAALSASAGRIRGAQQTTLRVSVLLTAAFILCWLPYNVMQSFKVLKDPDWYTYKADMANSLNALLVFNSVLNPFLYGMLDKFSQFVDES